MILNWFNKFFLIPIVRLFVFAKIKPNHITLLGLVFAIVCFYLLINGMWLIASLILLFSGFFDMLDGSIARYSNNATLFGKFLDSFIDRVCESLILCGILIYFIFSEVNNITSLLAYTTICTSIIVSYSRARAESLGIESKEGLMTRAPRVLSLTIGLLIFSFSQNPIISSLSIIDITLLFITILSVFTIIQRVINVKKQTTPANKHHS